ncbi:MAG: PH domain-containing protein [Alphaproteobacteria bacterium]
MGYVEKTLGRNERIVRKARFHWILYAAAWLSLLFLGVLIIGIIIFVRLMIWLRVTEVAVTDNRIIYKRGWLSRSTEELNLRSIEEINLKQSVLGRLFGYGRLSVHGTGQGGMDLPNIAEPLEFRTAIQSARLGEAG